MIEKNLIQFWHDKNKIPSQIDEAIKTTKKNNLDYNVLLVDDSYMYDFISKHYNRSILRLYEFNLIPASRSDMARLMLLYEFGGVYVDASIELQDSLDFVIDRNYELIFLQKDNAPRYKNFPEKSHITNAFIAAKKKSPFIKWCIDKIIINLVSGEHNQRVLAATGPFILNQGLANFNEKFSINKLQFSKLNNVFFKSRRVEGVNNDWVRLEMDGIIDPEYYEKNRRSYSKLLIWKKWIFHFSFGSLSFKD